MSAATFGPDVARCEVLTFRQGLLSSMAHDLVLRVTGFRITVDAAAPSVDAVFDPRSLRVATALRDGKVVTGELGAGDVRKIEQAIVGEVLRAERFPEIRFASTSVTAREGGYDVVGKLTLTGTTREISAAVAREGNRLEAEVPLDQPHFAIRPYSALLGAIRVQPRVIVRISVPAA
jgi:hypothetical protein